MKYLILLLVIFGSCKKSTDTQEPDYTEQNKALLVGKWAYSVRTVSPAYDWDGNGTAETNVFAVMSDCQKGFFIEYKSAGGIIKQDCTQPNKSITWELQDNGKLIKYVIAGVAHGSENIVSINSTTLVTETKIEPPSGPSYILTNTYIK